MATAWTYSDWETTTADGSSARLTRLRLHIKEVSDALLGVNISYPGGRSHEHPDLDAYLASLRAEAKTLERRVEVANGTRIGFSRGRAIPE